MPVKNQAALGLYRLQISFLLITLDFYCHVAFEETTQRGSLAAGPEAKLPDMCDWCVHIVLVLAARSIRCFFPSKRERVDSGPRPVFFFLRPLLARICKAWIFGKGTLIVGNLYRKKLPGKERIKNFPSF